MDSPTNSKRLEIRADQEFLKKLDEWRRKQPDLPNRAEALRRAADQAFAQAS
jgi:metal-responsive CopG/Arc/MetJ family transcriptional regulator